MEFEVWGRLDRDELNPFILQIGAGFRQVGTFPGRVASQAQRRMQLQTLEAIAVTPDQYGDDTTVTLVWDTWEGERDPSDWASPKYCIPRPRLPEAETWENQACISKSLLVALGELLSRSQENIAHKCFYLGFGWKTPGLIIN